MLGDLVSSFLKRRLNMPPSSRATVIDQIPECLLPTLAIRSTLGLGALDVIFIVIIFFLGHINAFPTIFQMEDKKSSLLNCPILTTQSMKRNFWRAIEPRGYDRGARARGCIANHVTVFPRA